MRFLKALILPLLYILGWFAQPRDRNQLGFPPEDTRE